MPGAPYDAGRPALTRSAAPSRRRSGCSSGCAGRISPIHFSSRRPPAARAGGEGRRPARPARKPAAAGPEARREAVVDAYLAGASAAEAAEAHGVSASSVLRWVSEAGHKPRGSGSRGASGGVEAVAAYLAGATAKEVASTYGVRANTVLKWVREAGHTPRPGWVDRKGTEPSREAVVDAYRAGASAAAAAEAHGVSAWTVLAWVRQAGHEPRSAAAAGQVAHAAAAGAYLAGASAASVGTAFGVSRRTVLGWVRAAGHAARPVGHKLAGGSGPAAAAALRRAEAVAAYIDGASAKAAAEARGVSASSVLRWARQAAVAAYLAGASAETIGARVGGSGATVLRWVREAGHAPRKRGRSGRLG